jgi:hypothetical protein
VLGEWKSRPPGNIFGVGDSVRASLHRKKVRKVRKKRKKGVNNADSDKVPFGVKCAP